jgi:hypothetical protein
MCVDNAENIAVRAIQEIYTLWQIDPDDAKWVGDPTPEVIKKSGYGFEWLPGDFRVLVLVHGPHPEDPEVEDPVFRITVTTDFLSEVDITKPGFLEKLCLFNRFCPSFAIYTVPIDVAEQYDLVQSE